jgi:hypothetical protein
VEREERGDRFTALEDKFAGYEVYDQAGENIGKVDDLCIEENANYEYVGVKTGLLGTKTTLIPWRDSAQRLLASGTLNLHQDGLYTLARRVCSEVPSVRQCQK